MNSISLTSFRFCLGIFAAGSLLPLSAQTGLINPAVDPSLTNATAVVGAKVRISNVNWDMSLDAGGGTNAGNFIQHSLGNNTELSNDQFTFTLQHIANEGFVFSLVNVSEPVRSGNLSWGTFTTPPPAGPTSAVINSKTPGAEFNALHIAAYASGDGMGVAVSNLSFSSPTLTNVSGSFVNTSLDRGLSGVTTLVGDADQWLVSLDNLALYDWALTATVSLYKPAGVGGEEAVKFVVDGKRIVDGVYAIPEPSTYALAAGLAVLAHVVLRRRSRRPASG